jgi:hypothetical protein
VFSLSEFLEPIVFADDREKAYFHKSQIAEKLETLHRQGSVDLETIFESAVNDAVKILCFYTFDWYANRSSNIRGSMYLFL